MSVGADFDSFSDNGSKEGDINLDTKTLTVVDNKDVDQSKNIGGGLGFGQGSLNTINFNYENKDKQGETRTTMAAGGELNVNIRDADKDGVEGSDADRAAAETIIASINRDAATWQTVTKDEHTKISGELDVANLRDAAENLKAAQDFIRALTAKVDDSATAGGAENIDIYRRLRANGLYDAEAKIELQSGFAKTQVQVQVQVLRNLNAAEEFYKDMGGVPDFIRQAALADIPLVFDGDGAKLQIAGCGTNGADLCNLIFDQAKSESIAKLAEQKYDEVIAFITKYGLSDSVRSEQAKAALLLYAACNPDGWSNFYELLNRAPAEYRDELQRNLTAAAASIDYYLVRGDFATAADVASQTGHPSLEWIRGMDNAWNRNLAEFINLLVKRTKEDPEGLAVIMSLLSLPQDWLIDNTVGKDALKELEDAQAEVFGRALTAIYEKAHEGIQSGQTTDVQADIIAARFMLASIAVASVAKGSNELRNIIFQNPAFKRVLQSISDGTTKNIAALRKFRAGGSDIAASQEFEWRSPTATTQGASNIATARKLADELRLNSANSPFTLDGKLTTTVIKESRAIIEGKNLKNPNIPPGYDKYASPTFQSPSGDFQLHYYYNPETRNVLYTLDYKVLFNKGGISP